MISQNGHKNDLWNAYRYGDKIKIVYYKCGKEACKSARKRPKHKICEANDEEVAERLAASISRTKATIFELAMCNAFEYFVTLTLSAEKRDRFALKNFSRDFGQFVRNENKKRPEGQKIEYLLIPEQHQDGAWHAHGLIKGLTGNDLKRNTKGYLEWFAYSKRFGFFSCSAIKSHEACCKYITKYITKDVKKSTDLQAGAHSYYASQGLQRRELLERYAYGDNLLFDPRGEWDFENEWVKILWLKITPEGVVKDRPQAVGILEEEI